jgi:hypothetical protein
MDHHSPTLSSMVRLPSRCSTPRLRVHFLYSTFSSPIVACCIPEMPEQWCTVTVMDVDGRRHDLDLQAASSFDSAHVYRATQRHMRSVGNRGLATTFEVVVNGKVYHGGC